MLRLFNRFVPISLLLLSLTIAGCGNNNHAQSMQQNLVFYDLQGHALKLADFHGKWVFINYWASWCKPCYQEIPELNRFYKKHHNDVVLLGFSYDQQQGESLAKLANKMGIEFPTLSQDPAAAIGIKSIPGLPATYVINPKGKLSEALFGMQTRKSLEQAIGKS